MKITSPLTIEKFVLAGFRAYVRPQTFSLYSDQKPCSLAVYAPNGMGKSSLVDSFEYYFSKEQTLRRLGKKISTYAGPVAMKNVEADQEGIVPKVHFWFKQGTNTFDDSRAVQGPLPQAAKMVCSYLKVLPVIRGYELRRFVEDDTPGARYKELATWFALDSLLDIQFNLRSLRRKVKEESESTAGEGERLEDLKDVTDNSISVWDEEKIRDWYNHTVLFPLDGSLKLLNFSDESSELQELMRKEKDEQEQIGPTQLTNLSNKIESLLSQPTEQAESSTGTIAALKIVASEHRRAIEHENSIRQKAGNSIFNDIWESALKLFESDSKFNTCPICGTNISASHCGSRAGVHENLRKHLSQLKEYRIAKTSLNEAESRVNLAKDDLKSALEIVSSLLDASEYQLDEMSNYIAAIRSWDIHEDLPESTRIIAGLADILSSINTRIAQIEQDRGEHTYHQALRILQRLIQIRADLKRIAHTKKHLKQLEGEIALQTREIDGAITQRVQSLIGALQVLTNTLYKEIQGDSVDAPPIRLELPNEDAVEQREIRLLIDFKGLKGVIPSGYLSDSQLHTLALALRLAAIRMFNSGAPLMVLDDVVTSYDWDRRTHVAKVLGKHFNDFQVVLVTHDEQFFKLLLDYLPANHWNFKRITELRPQFGPNFEDHQTQDLTIEEKLGRRESAAVEIRMAEEEWLYWICIDFETQVSMLPLARKHERSELAASLARFLKKIKIQLPQVHGIQNSFLTSLQRGIVENFGSHFSDITSGGISVEDERERWNQFKYFRDLFVCPCGSHRFKRPRGLDKPVCKKCEKPFTLTALSA